MSLPKKLHPNAETCLKHVMREGKEKFTVGCEALLVDAENRPASLRHPVSAEFKVRGWDVDVTVAGGTVMLKARRKVNDGRVVILDADNKEIGAFPGWQLARGQTVRLIFDGLMVMPASPVSS